MGKFLELEQAVFQVFGAAEWTSKSIPTFPENWTIENPGDKFIRVSVVPSGKSLNLISAAGVVIVDIFTSAGTGFKESASITDSLDLYLSGKSIRTSGGTVQFQMGSMARRGEDRDNPSLYRSVYTIPFNFFGVQ